MFERRLRLFLLFIFLGAFLLAARATQVQVLQRDEWAARANDDIERPTYISARRGDLLDFKGRVLATDVPSFEASVNFRVLGKTPDARWFKQESERRARKLPGWVSADEDERLLLIAEQQQGVRNDLDEMWATVARVTGKKTVEIDALREGIVDEVRAKHDQYVQRRFLAATKDFEEAPATPWYARLIVGSPRAPDVTSFEKDLIGDQLGFHVILPDLTQEQYNALALAQDKFPQYKPDNAPSTSVLKLGPAVRRNYPYADVACHVIGHVGVVSAEDRVKDANKDDELRRYSMVDRIGRDGLESLAEQQLRGTRGTKFADRRGANLRAEEATPGQEVRASIDIELQRDIQEAFKTVNFQTPDEDPARPGHKIMDVLPMNGAAVVIDVKTGQVRALVSVPTFDLNRFDELYESLVEEDLARPMTNRALLDSIEPGSTVKPIVGLGAVTQKLATADDTIECTGFPIINGRRLEKPRCWTESIYGNKGLGAHHVVPTGFPHPTGFLNLTDAIERSCNVYFETQGYKLGLQGLSYWMRQFGYGRPSGIGLPEARGLVPDKAKIDAEDRGSAPLYAAIGQSTVLATPMQVANEMATIARDGVWQRPTLLVNPPPPSPTTKPADPDAIPDRYDLHLDPAALRAVHEGMIKVVNSDAGTGKQVRSDSVIVAAKTGSATATQLIRFRKNADGTLLRDQNDRALYDVIEYGRHGAPNPAAPWYRMSGVDDNGKAKGTHSWVAGYLPADGEPQIAFAVYVEYGGSGGIGAGSVANKLIESCIKNGYVRANAATSTARE